MKEIIEREEKFKYPSDYNPDDIIKGSFGIYEISFQKPINVRVSFDESLWDRISNRDWHRTQNISPIKDGRFELMAILTNVIEFKPWLLQFGCLATVLEPDWLREEIKAELIAACRNY